MPAVAPPDLPEQANPHFMQSLVALSETTEIEVTEDVFAQNGTKLLAKGARVDSRLYERVINHKLRRPIESSLACRDAFDARQLVSDAEVLLEESSLLRHLGDWSHGRVTPLGMLERVRFSPQAATLLAVAQHKRPERRQHQIKTCLVAMSLAQALQFNDPQLLASLAQASLLHDVGECYVDPAIFSTERELSSADWRALATHPIIGAALAREIAGLDAMTQAAILQHHERLDGSGYPRGLGGVSLSRAGAILGIADTVAALLTRPYSHQRIGIALKIMPHEFSPELVNLVSALIHECAEQAAAEQAPSAEVTDDIHHVFERIANILTLFHELLDERGGLSPLARETVESLLERFIRVQRAFASTGMDGFDSLSEVLEPHELGEARLEARCVLDEIHWRLTRLSRELSLRALAMPETESQPLMRLALCLSG